MFIYSVWGDVYKLHMFLETEPGRQVLLEN